MSDTKYFTPGSDTFYFDGPNFGGPNKLRYPTASGGQLDNIPSGASDFSSTISQKEKSVKLVNHPKGTKEQSLKDLELEVEKDNNKLVRMWLNGINPSTGRHIKIWGSKWMEIMDYNGWHQYVEPIDLKNAEKYNATFLAFQKKHTPVK